jgi:flagellar biosynthetic protein FliR
MAGDLFAVDRILSFLLILGRVAGIFSFFPLPGADASPAAARIVLSFAIAICLYPIWPPTAGLDTSVMRLAGLVAMEAAIGMVIGLSAAFAVEALKLAAQISGLQAGFGYASTVDPATQADASLLQVAAELTGGLMLFTGGFDRQMLAILAGSIKTIPPGQTVHFASAPGAIIRLGGELFARGLRMALPVIALLLLIDLSLAFLGRINAQLQLLTLAFPVKIICALGLFTLLIPVYVRVSTAFLQHSLERAAGILLRH